jgi:hypothetical protein
MNDRTPAVEQVVAVPNPMRRHPAMVIKAGTRPGADNPWITFALVAVGTFMTMLDGSIVNA